MRKSILTTLIVATALSSFAGVASAQSSSSGRGGNSGPSGGDGIESRQHFLKENLPKRRYYRVVRGKGSCNIERVRRYDAWGNFHYERVRLCDNREFNVY